MGFEYGYSAEAPETLVLWEAQFGDFGNGAQVIIDQFIVSGLAKWGQTTRLTLLLPHGYEGSGPEHSSARLERFLQLAAEGNIRVANLTTPAQYFHLLRRQARIAKQRPLIIMSPKSLLRLPQATNRIEHLAETQFYPVLGEPRVPIDKVTRLVLCTGKIYYDLVGHPDRQDNEGVAIGRVELLYPFPEAPDHRARRVLPEPAARSSGCRRSRATWAPARTCRRACMQILPDAPRVRLHRPARARLTGRGLPGRAHRRAEPHHPDRAGPVDRRSRCTRRRRRASARPRRAAHRRPRSGASSGLRRSSSSRQPGLQRRSRGGRSRDARSSRSPALRHAQAGPEQQLVVVGRQRERLGARKRAGLVVAPLAHQLVGLARRARTPRCTPSRRRSSLQRLGVVLDAQLDAIATPRPRPARRAAPPTGGRGRRRPRPRRPSSAASSRSRERALRRLEAPRPSRPRRARWPSCSPGAEAVAGRVAGERDARVAGVDRRRAPSASTHGDLAHAPPAGRRRSARSSASAGVLAARRARRAARGP